MKCLFVDSRLDFFRVLAEKLGSEFNLTSAPAGAEHTCSCDVILLGIPPVNDSLFQERMLFLQKIMRTPGAAPVVACVPQSERQITRMMFEAGAYDCFVE